jgi:1,4-alpha-glucan branching enzyme
MSIKKQHLKNRPYCKVSFRVSKEAANAAKSIHLVGDFNDWNPQETPMTALKSGEFTAMVELETSTPEYQFRYLCDGEQWINDDEADGYATNGIDGENFIVRV